MRRLNRMSSRVSPTALLRNLSWRAKSLLILVGSAFLFLGIVAGIQFWVVLPSVERNEMEAMRRQLDQIAGRHEQRQDRLLNDAGTLAQSTRVRGLLEHPNDSRDEKRELADELRRAPFDLLMIWDAAGDLAFGQTLDRRTRFIGPPPGRAETIFASQGLSSLDPALPRNRGVLVTPRGLLLFARHLVRTAGASSPVIGVVMVGEHVPLNLLENSFTGSELRMRLHHPNQPPAALPNAEEVAPGQLIAPMGENEIVGRLMFNDLKERYAGSLEIRVDRPFRATQIQNTKLELLVLGALIVALCGALWLVIEFAFIRRLERLTQLVGRLDQPEAVKALETFSGDDEVGRLARTTGQTANNLNQTRDLAVTADRAKSAFLRVMSHELRTPMNGVIGFSTLLRDTPLNSEQAEFVKGIDESGQTMLKLIDDLLDYTTMEASGVVLNPRPLQFREWLREATQLLSPEFERKRLQFQTEIATEVPTLVWCDPARLQQVLLHLLGNAIKFTPAGAVRLIVEMAAYGPGEQGMLRFRVLDTGIGIAPEIRPMLFHPFTQGDASNTRRFSGVGMGLVICQRLVHAMGGTIRYDSEPGKGSEFSFTISVRMSFAAPSEETLPTSRHRRR